MLTEKQLETMEMFLPRVLKLYTTVRLSFGDSSIKTMDYVFLYLDVDRVDIVSINDKHTGEITAEERSHIYEWLTENGWAEWRMISDEDSELFASDRLMRIVRANDKYSSSQGWE